MSLNARSEEHLKPEESIAVHIRRNTSILNIPICTP